MIFKRAAAQLRAQDWMAISIELVIVIVGVFIGIWVANWNQERVKKQETREMLVQLKPTRIAPTTRRFIWAPPKDLLKITRNREICVPKRTETSALFLLAAAAAVCASSDGNM